MTDAVNHWFNECVDSDGNRKFDTNGRRFIPEKIANLFGVGVQSFRDRLNGVKSLESVENQGQPRYFSDDEEHTLLALIKIQSRMGFGLMSKQVRGLMQEYVDKYRPELSTFNSKSFLQRFVEKYGKDINHRTPNRKDYGHLKACKPLAITDFIENVLSVELNVCKQHWVTVDNLDKDLFEKHCDAILYNADETNISTHGSGKIIAERGRPVTLYTDANKYSSTSLLVCGNSAGHMLQPLIIFRSTHMDNNWRHWSSATYAFSDSGYINNDLFTNWLNDEFIPSSHALRPEGYTGPLILILDGHASHFNINSLELAKSYNITLLRLPSNLTNLIQPLDVNVFGPLKAIWNTIVHEHRIPGTLTGKAKTVDMLRILWETSQPIFKRCLQKGFQMTGIHPLNPLAMSDVLFETSNLYPFKDSQWRDLCPNLKNFERIESIDDQYPMANMFIAKLNEQFAPKPQSVTICQPIPDNELRQKRGSIWGENMTKRRPVLKDSTNSNEPMFTIKDITKHMCVRCFTDESGLDVKWIECSQCFRWYHIKCHPGDVTQLEELSKVPQYWELFSWLTSKLRDGGHLCFNPHLILNYWAKDRKRIDDLIAENQRLESEIRSLNEDKDSLKSAKEMFENENKLLNTENKNLIIENKILFQKNQQLITDLTEFVNHYDKHLKQFDIQ